MKCFELFSVFSICLLCECRTNKRVGIGGVCSLFEYRKYIISSSFTLPSLSLSLFLSLSLSPPFSLYLPPLSPSLLPPQEWHDKSQNQSEDLLEQLLFGLEDATEEAIDGLRSSIDEIFEKTRNLNDKKIQLKCGEVQRQVEVIPLV